MIILPATDQRRVAIESGTIHYAQLVTLTIGEDIYRITSAHRDITIGGTTWRSSPDLIGSSYPKHDSDYQRDFWELEFAEYATNERSKDKIVLQLNNAQKDTTIHNRLTFSHFAPQDSRTTFPSHWFDRKFADVRLFRFTLDVDANCIIGELHGGADLIENIKYTLRVNGNVVTGTWFAGSENCAVDSTTLAQTLYANANAGDDGELELELVHVPWHKRFSENYSTNSEIEVAYALRDATQQGTQASFTNSLIVYRGIGGAVTSTVDRQNRFITSVQFTGPLTRLDNDYARTTTQASQQEVDADDTSMNFAHENDTVLTWSA